MVGSKSAQTRVVDNNRQDAPYILFLSNRVSSYDLVCALFDPTISTSAILQLLLILLCVTFSMIFFSNLLSYTCNVGSEHGELQYQFLDHRAAEGCGH